MNRIFKALANDSRIRIYRLLLSTGKELCICEIMDALKMTQYNVSKHIRELKIAGLAEEKREGRFIYYSAIPPDTVEKKYIIKAVISIKNGTLETDAKNLKKRLALRRNGKPVLCCGRK